MSQVFRVYSKAIVNTTPGNNLSTLKQPCMVTSLKIS